MLGLPGDRQSQKVALKSGCPGGASVAMDVCPESSHAGTGLSYAVLCLKKGTSGLRPTCRILASVETPLAALSPPSLLMGPHWS